MTHQGILAVTGEQMKVDNDVQVLVLQTDLNGKILECEGVTVPTDGKAGYRPGCRFRKTTGAVGATVYINEGSVTSCDFNLSRTTAEPGAVQYAEVAVSIAELKAIRATPKELVAAPGTGKLLEFLSATFIYDYAAVYTESADDMVVRFTNGSGAVASTTLDATGLLDQTADQIRTFKAITTDITPVANAALVLHNTGDGEYGGTGSPCRIKVAYRIHSTGL